MEGHQKIIITLTLRKLIFIPNDGFTYLKIISPELEVEAR